MDFLTRNPTQPEAPNLDEDKALAANTLKARATQFRTSENPIIKGNAAEIAYLFEGLRHDTLVDVGLVFNSGIQMSQEQLDKYLANPTDRVLATSLFFEFFNVLDDSFDNQTKKATGEQYSVTGIDPETGERSEITMQKPSLKDLFQIVLRDKNAFNSKSSQRQLPLSKKEAADSLRNPNTLFRQSKEFDPSKLELSGYQVLDILTSLIADSEEYEALEKEQLLGDTYINSYLKGELDDMSADKRFSLLMQSDGRIPGLVKSIMQNVGRYAEASKTESKAAFLLRYGTIAPYFSIAADLALSSSVKADRDSFIHLRAELRKAKHNGNINYPLNVYELLSEKEQKQIARYAGIVESASAINSEKELNEMLTSLQLEVSEEGRNYGTIPLFEKEQADLADAVIDSGMRVQFVDDVQDLTEDLHKGVANPVLAVLRESGITDDQIEELFNKTAESYLLDDPDKENVLMFVRTFVNTLKDPDENVAESLKQNYQSAYEKIKLYLELAIRADIEKLLKPNKKQKAPLEAA